MTIRVKKDRIDFDNGFSIVETADGFSFNGVINAKTAQRSGFQGATAGWTAGGYVYPGTSTQIEKIPFATAFTHFGVGQLTASTYLWNGHSSGTDGYASGGATPTANIEKFPFASGSVTTVVHGTLASTGGGGFGVSSNTDGYSHMGYPPFPSTGKAGKAVYKFPFAVAGNISNQIFQLNIGKQGPASQQNTIYGFASGGRTDPPTSPTPSYVGTTNIEKFQFGTDYTNFTVGALTQARITGPVYAYTAGGYQPTFVATIDKFPMVNNYNATSVGSLSVSKYSGMGNSSATSGYVPGGNTPVLNTVETFPFATDTNATNVGSLFTSRYVGAPAQV
jgi:hypothetical protein